MNKKSKKITTKDNVSQIPRERDDRKIISQTYTGPIPPSSELSKYEEIIPGAANRIISMAEEESKHRQITEIKIIHNERMFGLVGQIAAIFVVTAVASLEFYVVYTGNASQAATVGMSIAAVASVFIYKRK